MFYYIFMLYEDGKVTEFLTKDAEYVRVACKAMIEDDNLVDMRIQYIKEIK